MWPAYLIFSCLLVLTAWLLYTYSRLGTLRNSALHALAQLKTHITAKHELVATVIDTADQHMSFEKKTCEALCDGLVRARNSLEHGPIKMAEENAQLQEYLTKFFSFLEDHPDLQEDVFIGKQKVQLLEIDRKLSNAVAYYNGRVEVHNRRFSSIPAVFFADLFGFKKFTEF